MAMLDIAGQQWLDGAQSIIDPRRKGRQPFPLCVLSFWRTLSTIVQKQEDWKEAHHFVSIEVLKLNVCGSYPSIESVFRGISWDGPVQCGSFTFTTHKFVKLLRPIQLCDDIAQTMIDDLQQHCQDQPGHHEGNIIAASRFYSVLQVAVERDRLAAGQRLPSSLVVVEDAVDRNPRVKLWFPVLFANHEVVLCVDFGKQTISYGKFVV